MKRFLLFLTSNFLIQSGSMAQTNPATAEDSVKAVVNQLFKGMKSADPEMIRSSFGDSAILQTIVRGREGVDVKNERVADFVNSISSIPPGDADERIQFETIRIDGPLAIVWTPYQFYYKGQFSHCGVNSFQLVRIKGVWKIQYLIDTRRKQGCN